MSILDTTAKKPSSEDKDVTIAPQTQPWPGLTGIASPYAGPRRGKLLRLG